MRTALSSICLKIELHLAVQCCREKPCNHLLHYTTDGFSLGCVTLCYATLDQQSFSTARRNVIEPHSLYSLESLAYFRPKNSASYFHFISSFISVQELCIVKEERADLKARVYLLEKELHANRLALESRLAAERALRAHLDALRLSSQEPARGSSRADEPRDSRVGNGQTEVLLRGQVKVSLLSVLEGKRVRGLLSFIS